VIPGNHSWIFEDLMRIPHTRHAVVLSADGLVTTASKEVGRDLADVAAATASGLKSLSLSVAEFAGSQGAPWQQTMVRFEDAYVFLTAAGDSSYLAVSAGIEADVESVSYQMGKTIDRLSTVLDIAPRHLQAGSA